MTLYEAIEAGDLKAAKKLLTQGEYINQLGTDGRTPLIEAARAGNLAAVKMLLDAGAEAQFKDAEQETALLKAAANGHHAVCKLLMPLADEDERGMAEAFLGAFGKTDGPEEIPNPEPDFLGLKAKAEELTQKAAVLGARAAKFVGYDEPAERIERVERAEEHAGKKTERPKLKPKK